MHPSQAKLLSKFSFILLTVCMAIQSSAQSIDKSIPYEFRGIIEFGNSTLFSVRSTSTDSARWLTINSCYESLKVLGYNKRASILHVNYKGQALEIPLAKSQTNHASQKNANDAADSFHVPLKRSEIDSRTNAFREKELSKIPNVNTKLKEALKQAAENRVSAYRRELEERNKYLNSELSSTSTTSMDDKTLSTTQVAARVSIGIKRVRNNVNSRIWASDHIKKHGEPDENGKLVIYNPNPDPAKQ